MIAFASFVDQIGTIDHLVENIPVNRTSPNALPIRDIIVGLMLTILLDGKRFHDIRFVQNDPVVGEAFGVTKRIPGDDSVRRLLEQIDQKKSLEFSTKPINISTKAFLTTTFSIGIALLRLDMALKKVLKLVTIQPNMAVEATTH